MSSSEDTSFARLVSLACHDLRTPLATVHGFARTLASRDIPDARRYLTMMAEATDQLAELLDDLALVARIEGRRYDPALQETDTLELAGAAAERAGAEWASAAGDGGRVEVDRDAMIRALANLALCARRHGGVERVELTASRNFVAIEPVPDAAAPIILAEDLRDLGAAVARELVEAHGGSLELDGETLRVTVSASP